MTKDPNLLLRSIGRIRSHVGAFVEGRVIIRGKDLHNELGDVGWFDLYLFGITGRRFTAPVLKLLEAIWTCTSYPDSRIWNNRVVSLAGTVRSTGTLAIAGGLSVTEAKIYGHGPAYRAVDFFIKLRAFVDAGGAMSEMIENELAIHRTIGGYGRPVVGGKDERIEPLMKLASSLDLVGGPHLKLAHDVEEYMLSSGRPKLMMNFAALAGAFSADVGLSPREHYLFYFPIFLTGMAPCYLNALEQVEGTVFPLPCEGVSYVGVGKRPWK